MVSTVIMFGGISETGKEEILYISKAKKKISKLNQTNRSEFGSYIQDNPTLLQKEQHV